MKYKVSSFTKVVNSFRNYGRKVQATFRGGEIWDSLERYSPVICIESKRWSIKEWMWPSGEYNGHYADTPM